jgi:hypothetical protein
MAVMGDTELSATKQEVIAEKAQRALIAESAFLATVRDVSNRAKKGAESISFPKRSGAFTVEDRASGVAGSDQVRGFTKDTLTLSKRAHIQWVVDVNDEIESTLDVQNENISEASAEHAIDVDRLLIAEFELAGYETTTAGDITQDVVLEMRQTLLKNKAKKNDLYLAVSPKQEAKLLAIEPFVSAEKYGSAIVPNGVLGTLYGVKVIMSPELADDQYFMYESGAMSIGFQRKPSFDEQKAIEFGAGAMKQVLDQKYGVKALFVDAIGGLNAAGGALSSESALICKDNNA